MNNLKFDRARFDAGEMPTRTRDGRKVQWVADTGLERENPIIAIIEGDIVSTDYTRDGKFWADAEHDDCHDLVHEPRSRKLEIAVYRHPSNGGIYTVTSDAHDDFEAFVDRVNKAGRLLQVLEIEVSE